MTWYQPIDANTYRVHGAVRRSARTGRYEPTAKKASEPRLIRVSSDATGVRRYVRVYIYDTVEQLREAATRFNGNDFTDTLGVCQQYQRVRTDRDGRRISHASTVIVRLARGHLGTQIVVHEMNHAAVTIYGSSLQGNELAIDILDNANETLAHLQSDLTVRLVDRLYELGYYDKPQP